MAKIPQGLPKSCTGRCATTGCNCGVINHTSALETGLRQRYTPAGRILWKIVYMVAGLLVAFGLIANIYWLNNQELTQMPVFAWMLGW